MRFPCEYVSNTFLPGLRVRIAQKMSIRGYSQTKIALHLGVKQPVVASYLRKTLDKTDNSLIAGILDEIDISTITGILDELAERITSDFVKGNNLETIMRTICTRCKKLRMDNVLCSIHKKLLPAIATIQRCTICRGDIESLQSLENVKILQSLEETLTNIKEIDNISHWIPEIGAQLATCREKAEYLDDVASFPGRIIKVKDDIKTVSLPEFGFSKTMSSLLIWLHEINPNIKWIFSIKNRTELKMKLENYNTPFIETMFLDTKWNETLNNLKSHCNFSQIKVILDTSGPGYESIAYIIAQEVEELLEITKSIFLNKLNP